MSGTDISINELDRAERRFTIQTFLRSVDADVALTELAGSKRRVPYEDVIRALNLRVWPNSETTDVELAWLSESLCCSKFPRLSAYSVFGSFVADVKLWIGRAPRRPTERACFLAGGALVATIIRIYGIKVVELDHPNAMVNFAKRNWRPIMFGWGLPWVYLLSYLVYTYFRSGFSLATLLPVSMFLVSFLYFRYGLRYLSSNTFWLIVALAVFFGVPYFVYDPSEYVPFGSDSEYPHLAGFASSFVLGVGMWVTKELETGHQETLSEAFRSRFRTLRQGITLLSVSTVAGYPVFLLHAYAIHQIVVENNYLFIALMVFGVIAFSDFLHRLLNRG